MSMDGRQLGDEIFDAIIHPNATPEARATVKELWQKIGGVIVEHIQNNARVLSGISVSTNVTTTAAGVPGIGTGTGSTTGTGTIR